MGEREKEEDGGGGAGRRGDDIKELVQVIFGAGKSKIHRASWQGRDLGNS